MSINKPSWLIASIIPIAIFIIISLIFIAYSSFSKRDSALRFTQEKEFDLKIKCLEIRQDLEKRIAQFNAAQKIESRGDNDGSTLYCQERKELGEVFYSSKINTCLHVETIRTLCGSQPKETSHTSYEYLNLLDALTGETLGSIRTISRGSAYQNEVEFENIVNSFK